MSTDGLRRTAMAMRCPSCGAPPAMTCRRHRWGYEYPPAKPVGFRAKWRAWWSWFTPPVHPARYMQAVRIRRGDLE